MLELATQQQVMIVDDDPAARESVSALLQSHGLAWQAFGSAEDFLAHYDRTARGCLLLDVRMAGKSGVELLEQLATEKFPLPIIVITGYGNIPIAVRAMRAGAFSFLEKGGAEQELLTTIQEALAWETRSHEKEELRRAVQQRLQELTPDEGKVLERLVAGMANKAIAAELDIGLRTVELRRANVLKKMQARSLAELVRFALILEEKTVE